ncbi:copper resistance CopC family protein [Rathayibacter sp. YIM 133350]|uniref:copper resistance CopC family protein n=1 Tax=Rathayibacter sp. YIM 133350 TaxID=3131992 RepID=UPI00307CF0F5
MTERATGRFARVGRVGVRSGRPARRGGRLAALAAGVALVAASVAVATPAFAHNYPIGSTPANGATVTEQPGTISLTTNDNLLDFGSSSAMRVSGPEGAVRYYGDGCVSIEGPTLSMDAELGQPGTYTVTWQVVSTDGHPVSGQFTFDWQPAAEVVLATGSAQPPTCATAAPADGSGQTSPAAAPAEGAAASQGALTDILWIGGAVVALALAAGITLLVLRRREPKP